MDDLISREAVKEKFPLMENGFGLINERFHKGIDELPSAFDGMTNGEVMQAVYTDSEICIDETWKTVTVYLGADEDYCEDEVRFDLDWWNAPYKGVSE